MSSFPIIFGVAIFFVIAIIIIKKVEAKKIESEMSEIASGDYDYTKDSNTEDAPTVENSEPPKKIGCGTLLIVSIVFVLLIWGGFKGCTSVMHSITRTEVKNSLTNEVWQVEEYIEEKANGGDVTHLSWGRVTVGDGGNYVVRHEYYIGNTIYNSMFMLDKKGYVIEETAF